MVHKKSEIEKQIHALAEKIDIYGEKLTDTSTALKYVTKGLTQSLKTRKAKALPAVKELLLQVEIWMLKKQLKSVEDEIRREYSKIKNSKHSSVYGRTK